MSKSFVVTACLRVLVLLLLAGSSSWAQLTCPPMPDKVTQVNRDVSSDVEVGIGSLGRLKAGQVGAKTDVIAKNLFDKYPNTDRLLIAQMMSATYCEMIRNSKTINDSERIRLWSEFSERVFKFENPGYNPPPAPGRGHRSTPRRTPAKDTKEASDPFHVEIHSTTLNLDQLTDDRAATWWVKWKSNGQGEDLLSPVSLIVWADFTNVSSAVKQVKSIATSLTTSHCDGPISMYPIYLSQVQIYFAPYFHLWDTAHIQFPDTDLDSLLHAELPPSHTVSGWLYYHSPIRCILEQGDTVDVKMTIATYSGEVQTATEHKIVEPPRRAVTPHPENAPNSSHFTINGNHIDLREVKRTIYGIAPQPTSPQQSSRSTSRDPEQPIIPPGQNCSNGICIGGNNAGTASVVNVDTHPKFILTDEYAAELTSSAAPFRRMKVQIAYVGAIPTDQPDFTERLENSLKNAGLEVDAAQMIVSSYVPPGISFSANKDTLPLVQAIGNVLMKAGIIPPGVSQRVEPVPDKDKIFITVQKY